MKIKEFIKRNWSYALIIVLALVIRQTKVFAINIVDGESMMSTLHHGQIVLGSSIKSLKRGDVVVAKSGDKLVIKRIVGLPGEIVEYRNGGLYIDNKLLEEDYIEEGRDANSKQQAWYYEVPEDYYLILGDNRDNSYDGRYYGPIPKEEILEKIYIQF